MDLDGGERGQVKGLETCVPGEAVSDMRGTMKKVITGDDLGKDRDNLCKLPRTNVTKACRNDINYKC